MNLDRFHSFVTALTNIDNTDEYIAQDSTGKFTRVSKDQKQNKNLNTEQIAARGQDCLDLIANTTASFSKKAELYAQLSNALSNYSNRVYKHKNILEKIGWWFGFSAASEKKLYAESKQSAAQAGVLTEQNEKVQKAASELIKRVEARKHPLQQEKLFYASILDSTPISMPELEELRSVDVIQWMRGHLTEYRAHLEKSGSSRERIEKLDKIIGEFEDLGLFQSLEILKVARAKVKQTAGQLKSFLIDRVYPPYTSDWMLSEIQDRVNALKKPGDEVAIPGGYEGSEIGHSAVFTIRREDDKDGKKSYCLTIINTGEGSNQYDQDLIEQVKAKPPHEQEKIRARLTESSKLPPAQQLLTLAELGLRVSLTDREWRNIPEQAVNMPLIKLLVESRSEKNMEAVHKKVSDYLKQFNVSEKRGETHKAQYKATCGMKALTSWFHQRMGDTLWRDFKAFYTEREVARVPELKESYRGKFQTKGKEILTKRKGKLERAKASLLTPKPIVIAQPSTQQSQNPFMYFGIDQNHVQRQDIHLALRQFEAIEKKPILSWLFSSAKHYESSPGTLGRAAFTKVFNELNNLSENWVDTADNKSKIETVKTLLSYAMCMMEAQEGNPQAKRGYQLIKLHEFARKADRFLKFENKDRAIPKQAQEMMQSLYALTGKSSDQFYSPDELWNVSDDKLKEITTNLTHAIEGSKWWKQWNRFLTETEAGSNIESYAVLKSELQDSRISG